MDYQSRAPKKNLPRSVAMNKSMSAPSNGSNTEHSVIDEQIPLNAGAILNNETNLKRLHTKLESDTRKTFLDSKANQDPTNSANPKPFPNHSDKTARTTGSGSGTSRLLASHLSIYQTLENSKLNNMKDSMTPAATNSNVGANDGSVGQFLRNDTINHNGTPPIVDDPTAFSITSWQSIGSIQASNNSNQNQQLSGGDTNSHGRSVNSILSLSSDNEESVVNIDKRDTDDDQPSLPHRPSNAATVKLSNLINRTEDASLEDDSDYFAKDEDSDDSGTFEIDMNALIKTGNKSYLATARNTASATSPSFIMPKMMVAPKSDNLKIRYIRVCIIGNGRNRIQKELNEQVRSQTAASDTTYSFQYIFTNLNSKVDLVILIFDPVNGLYSKDLFSILASYKKHVLPVVYQTPIKPRHRSRNSNSKIETGGISDNSDSGEEEDNQGYIYDSNDSIFDVSESVLISLLANNGIKLFSRPIKLREHNVLCYDDLNQAIISFFISKFQSSFLNKVYNKEGKKDEDEDEEEDEEEDGEDGEDEVDDIGNIQTSTSTWASAIIQNRNFNDNGDQQPRLGSRSKSGLSVLRTKKRRMSGSNSSANGSKYRRKRVDKKKLSFTKINNSDPLKLDEKRVFVFNTFVTIGIGLGVVTAVASIVWYKKFSKDKLVNCKTIYKKLFQKEEFNAIQDTAKNTASAAKSDKGFFLNYTRPTKAALIGKPSSDAFNNDLEFIDLEILIDSAKKMIYKTKVLVLNSVSYIRDLIERLPSLLVID